MNHNRPRHKGNALSAVVHSAPLGCTAKCSFLLPEPKVVRGNTSLASSLYAARYILSLYASLGAYVSGYFTASPRASIVPFCFCFDPQIGSCVRGAQVLRCLQRAMFAMMFEKCIYKLTSSAKSPC